MKSIGLSSEHITYRAVAREIPRKYPGSLLGYSEERKLTMWSQW